MIFFEDMQTFVTVGPISIKWYAILILTGAFIAYGVSLYNFRKMGYDSELGDNLFVGSLLSGVVGARLWFVAFYDLQYYLRSEEHTSELQSRPHLVCRLLLEKKKKKSYKNI